MSATDRNKCTCLIKTDQLLVLYQSSKMHDCSFKVGKNKDTGFEVFKCHKLILASASSVFEDMFYGNGKEIHGSNPDDEIELLNDVSPAVFNKSMMFIYGDVRDFGDLFTAIDIYLFAHRMEVKVLLEAVEKSLKETATIAGIFAIYDAFKSTDSKTGLEWSWQLIKNGTSDALASVCWKDVSKETVEDLLTADDLKIKSESEIFEALVSWGKAQVLRENRALEATELRMVIADLLKLIRFRTMHIKEFAELCKNAEVLSLKEKNDIVQCITLETVDFMPLYLSKNATKRTLQASGKLFSFLRAQPFPE